MERFGWLRRYVSPVFLALLVASFILWYIAKLNYTYTTEQPFTVNVDGERFKVSCVVEGVGTNLFGYRVYMSKRLRIPLSELKFRSVKAEDGEKVQVFQKRIIIPVRDLDGSLVTFQGRDITGLAPNKYQFPSQVASTGKLLYNGNNIIGYNTIIVNEGVFDVIATQMALDKSGLSQDFGVVGSFGKHLSINLQGADDQLSRFLSLKKQGLRTIIIMWDGESMAYLDALEAAQKLNTFGFNLKIATLPAGKDPNEVYYTEVIDAIKNAKPYSNLMILQGNPYE